MPAETAARPRPDAARRRARRRRPEPGVAKPDPILVATGITRQFGGLKAVDVEHLEVQRGVITALIGPNGAGKTTFFNLLTGFDTPDTGDRSFNGKSLKRVSAHRVARLGMVRTFQLTKVLSKLTVLENMRLGATSQLGERFWAGPLRFLWAGQEDARSPSGPRAARPVQARRQGGRLRRLAVRRPAQAPRDGPRAHGQAGAGDARRADGRGQPGAQAVAARPREVAARGGHDRALRRARHGHGARHLRLGRRDGRRAR